MAQQDDPTKVDAEHYKVELENEQVRVLRINYGPGEKSVMHSHPAAVLVFLTDAHARFTYPDGKTERATPSKIRPAVRERVSLLVIGDGQGLTHALANLEVPGLAARLEAGRLPEGELQLVGARVIATTDEERPVEGDPLDDVERRDRAGDASWVMRWPDHDEIVVHHQLAVDAVASRHPPPLRLGGVDQ